MSPPPPRAFAAFPPLPSCFSILAVEHQLCFFPFLPLPIILFLPLSLPPLFFSLCFLILPLPIFSFSPSVFVFLSPLPRYLFFLSSLLLPFHLFIAPFIPQWSPLPVRNRWLASASPLDGFLPENTEKERERLWPMSEPWRLGSHYATDGRRRSRRKWKRRRRRRRRPTAGCDFLD